MNSFPELDRRSALAASSSGSLSGAPFPAGGTKPVPVVAVMGNRAFVRAWMVRRAQRPVPALGSFHVR